MYFLELDSHFDYENIFVLKSEQNWEILLKYANVAKFGPPFWILNDLRYPSKTIQQRPILKLWYSEILIKTQ